MNNGCSSQNICKPAKTGRPRNDMCTTVNGIFTYSLSDAGGLSFYQSTDKSAVHNMFHTLQQNGVWKKILKDVIEDADKNSNVDMRMSP